MDETGFDTLERIHTIMDRLDRKIQWLKWVVAINIVLSVVGFLVIGELVGRVAGTLGP